MKLRTALFSLCALAATISLEGPCAYAQTPSPKVGLVLSGGGARGLAHIGALKALEELRVPIDVITATSMGSMVGGGFAAGMSADEIKKLTLSIDWDKMFAPQVERTNRSWRQKSDDARGISPIELGLSKKGIQLPSGAISTQELSLFLSRATEPVDHIKDLSQLSIPFAAMATNLVTGKKYVLNKNVTLAKAMRASLSLPGVFTPCEVNGELLVDGALVDNLPVKHARSMGADIVVAINVGTPLNKREELNDIVGVMGQMINILTEQNVNESLASLTENDILITPDLKGFTAADFKKAATLIERGYKAVMAHKERFAHLSVDEKVYRTWQQACHEGMEKNREHNVSEIQIVEKTPVNSERTIDNLDIDLTKPVTGEIASESARRLWTEGDFSEVHYRFAPGPRGTEVLIFEPREKEMGYSTLKLGANLETNFTQSAHFNILLAHTWSWLNDWGGEWRNEIQLGHNRLFKTEFHQPLGTTSGFYVAPRIEYTHTPYEMYFGFERPQLTFRMERLVGGLFLGNDFAKLGRLEVGAGYTRTRSPAEVGGYIDISRIHSDVYVSPHAVVPAETFYFNYDSVFARAALSIDTLDNASFPRRGVRFNATYTGTRSNVHAGLVEKYNHSYQINGTLPVCITPDFSVMLSGEYNHSDDDYFTLGGAFKLSGSPFGKYIGSRSWFGRAMALYSVSDKFKEIGMPLYIGATYETGRAWYPDVRMDHDTRQQAVSVFVGLDSWIGPVYLIAGRTFGHSNALMLYWGRLTF